MYNTSRSVTEKIHGPRAKLKGPTLLQSLLCLLCAKLVLLPQTSADRVGSTGEMPKSLGPNQQLSATKPAEWTTSQGIGPT